MTLEINSYISDSGMGNDMNTGGTFYDDPFDNAIGGGGSSSWQDPMLGLPRNFFNDWEMPTQTEPEAGIPPGEMDGSEDLPADDFTGRGAESWEGVDPTDKDNEIADYLWRQSGPYTQGIFDGSYAAGLPNAAQYMQGTGLGSMQDYMGNNVGTFQDYLSGSGIGSLEDRLGGVDPLTSYFTDFMENNPAWEQNAVYGQNKLMETLGQYGGSASGGFSGQQAAGLGRYWSDQTADRWSQAAPSAMAQWGADYDTAGKGYMLDLGVAESDYGRQFGLGASDYGNLYGQHALDYGNTLSAYNRPYDYAQNSWGGTPVTGLYDGRANNNMNNMGGGSGSNTWSNVGTLAGMGLGFYLGGPAGMALGGATGSWAGGFFD